MKASLFLLSLSFGFIGGVASTLLFHPPLVLGAADSVPTEIKAHSFLVVDQSGQVVASLTSQDGPTLNIKTSNGNNATTILPGAMKIHTSTATGSLEGDADFGSSHIDLGSQNGQTRIKVNATQAAPTIAMTFGGKGATLSSDGKIRPIP